MSQAPEAAPVYPSPVAAWSAVAIMFLLAVLAILDRSIMTLLVEPIQADLQLSDTAMGLILGIALAVPNGLMSLPVGWAVDRYPRRAVIAIGVGVWSLGTAATGLASSVAGLFVARGVIGAGEASLAPAQQSMLSDMFPMKQLGLAFSITNMGWKAGTGVSLLIAASLVHIFPPADLIDVPLVGQLAGWKVIFLAVGLPGFLFIPLIYLMKEPVRHGVAAAGDHSGSGYRDYFAFFARHWRFLLPHHIGFLSFVALFASVNAWMPSFLVRVHQMPAATAGGWLGTAMLVAPLIGMPLHGALADYFYRRGVTDIHVRYPMITALLGLPFGAAAFLVSDPYVSIVMIAIFVFFIACYTSLPLVAAITSFPGRLRGKASSFIILVCSTGGIALGPLTVGRLTDAVFRDPNRLGDSLLCAMVIFTFFVVAPFFAALGPLRTFKRGEAAA